MRSVECRNTRPEHTNLSCRSSQALNYFGRRWIFLQSCCERCVSYAWHNLCYGIASAARPPVDFDRMLNLASDIFVINLQSCVYIDSDSGTARKRIGLRVRKNQESHLPLSCSRHASWAAGNYRQAQAAYSPFFPFEILELQPTSGAH